MPLPSAGSITCPWCRQYFPIRPATSCSNCGGPLPPAVGADRGPRPPQPPRRLPPPYIKAVMFSKNLGAILGLVFLLVGSAVEVGGLVAAASSLGALLLLVPFGAIFSIIGLFVFRAGRRSGRNRIEALEEGIAVEGDILDAAQDFSQSINGRHPWRIEYTFEVNGQRQGGFVVSWTIGDGARQKGEPVWVVYLPRDPTISSVWPPIV